MDSNENCKKQISLTVDTARSHKSQVLIVDFNVARENRDNSKKEKAISAILKEAEQLTW